MELHQLRCSNCGAFLDNEDGLETFYCKYCGTKVIATGQTDAAIRAKADIKLAEMAIKRERQQQEHEERKRQQSNKAIILAFLLFVVFWLIMYFLLCCI